jgi:hypothetical protein
MDKTSSQKRKNTSQCHQQTQQYLLLLTDGQSARNRVIKREKGRYRVEDRNSIGGVASHRQVKTSAYADP